MAQTNCCQARKTTRDEEMSQTLAGHVAGRLFPFSGTATFQWRRDLFDREHGIADNLIRCAARRGRIMPIDRLHELAMRGEIPGVIKARW